MRKTRLEKKLAKLNAKRDELTARALASQDANEVRSINEQLADVNDEIADVNDELAEIAEDEKRAAAPAAVPTNAQPVNGEIRAINYVKLKRAYFGTYDINKDYACDPYDPGAEDSNWTSGWV